MYITIKLVLLVKLKLRSPISQNLQKFTKYTKYIQKYNINKINFQNFLYTFLQLYSNSIRYFTYNSYNNVYIV
ncbi:hypothetical protein RIR_jg35097.t1 [Rhizophagus irregularis DAOM 181602=DAOM 197198]|uniref:Uncharacterized protein n=1 Tax=Rhizophagus irregularis (strain DAOM 181602 / DAOM 197198 / MUCL 43194) TaxID=747089 RepID=U9SZB0_RHIID|nr:hypothetical protein RIR_jg35097.t1 [Rhizophagus irregularis DAOM 181602=DAOM 197198]